MTHVLILSAHSSSMDRRIIAQANSLQTAGYEVDIVSVPIRADFLKIIHPDIQVFYETPTNHSSVKISIKKAIAKMLGHTLTEKIRFFQRQRYAQNNLTFFMNFPYKKNYDVIHAHDLDTLPAAIKLKEKLFPQAKIIYDAHEFYAKQFPHIQEQEYWLNLEESCLEHVDHVITVNPSIRRLFKDFYMNCPQIEVIYNSYGFEKSSQKLSQDDFKKFSGITDDLPVVIFQGGLSKERNLINLVQAFEGLHGIANLLIIGDGPLKINLDEIKKSRNLDNVFLKEWVAQDFLSAVLEHASFGIIPYSMKSLLNNLYCTPNKLFEYIAHHVPICANFLPEVATIVSTHNIGKVYQLTTPNKIKDAIIDFLNYYPSILADNFERADEAFCWKAQEDILLSIYNKTMQGFETFN